MCITNTTNGMDGSKVRFFSNLDRLFRVRSPVHLPSSPWHAIANCHPTCIHGFGPAYFNQLTNQPHERPSPGVLRITALEPGLATGPRARRGSRCDQAARPITTSLGLPSAVLPMATTRKKYSLKRSRPLTVKL